MIYENIKKIGDKKGMPIYAIEKKAGIGNGVIGKWRTLSPTLDTLIKVADALDVPVEYLIHEDGAKNMMIESKLNEVVDLLRGDKSDG